MRSKILAGIAGAGLILAGLSGPASADTIDWTAPAAAVSAPKVAPKSPPPFINMPDGTRIKTPPRKASDPADTLQAGKAGLKFKPPAPPNTQAKRFGTPTYHYAGGSQTFAGAGVTASYANVFITAPFKSAVDDHSLAEISAQRGGQMVEVGWIVAGANTQPELFVFNWVNGVAGCYNGCGWVDYGPNLLNAGANLGTGGQGWNGTSKQMGIQFFNNDWWISVNGSWLGYFPGTEWTLASPAATFVDMAVTQLFGEVVLDVPNTECSDMGTGIFGSVGGATPARFGSYANVGGPSNTLTLFTPTNASYYDAMFATGSVRTFTYGGPGAGGSAGSC